MPKKKTAKYEVVITRKLLKELIDAEAQVVNEDGDEVSVERLEIPEDADIDLGERVQKYDDLTGWGKKYRGDGSGTKNNPDKPFITVKWEEEESF
jgi:hypothetical protein